MAYAALADMLAKYGNAELIAATTDLDTPLDTIDQGKVQAALDQASSRMDSYLRRLHLALVNRVQWRVQVGGGGDQFGIAILRQHVRKGGVSHQPTSITAKVSVSAAMRSICARVSSPWRQTCSALCSIPARRMPGSRHTMMT